MANILEQIDFGNEAADDVDPEELISYFVEQERFDRFLDPRRKFLVATARKGVGKSALLQWIAYKVAKREPDALVIRVRGADLTRSKFGLTSTLSDPNEHISDWMVRLCALVNRQLALQLNIALTDDRITLIETAELEGYKSRNLVSCLMDRLQTLSEKGKVKKLRAKNEIELLKRAKDRNVWIVIDDLDATYQNTKEESISLATFFSACRYLTRDMKGLFFRVSMRTDVWPLVRRYDEASDKVEQYVSEILWAQKDFLQLLSLRVKASLEGIDHRIPNSEVSTTAGRERLLDLVFTPDMPWGDGMVRTYKVLYTLSYERPRWAIQLCKLAQEAALRSHGERITRVTIDNVWGEYGAKRIADLVAEHKHQCPEVEELVNGFRGCKRTLNRDALFDWINRKICNHLAPLIEGSSSRSAREIAYFLYRIGFIVARSEEGEGYEHYRFDQMPDFLSARTNEDFNVMWEIHPCYREALDIKKLNRSHKERFIRLRGGHN